jgi:poly(A) polymerase/tRNA nucleotidyltransferase (CCA-adding enzyme)
VRVAAFPDDPALGEVLAVLPGARLVGGCVRDAVLGITAADIDIATPMPPEEVSAALRRAGLKAVPTGIAHGTITAVARHRGFEVTTLRRDVRTDGRHAEVAWTDDWQADAARRDFTINAMSMTRDGEVFDYFAGLEDLRAGIVRFVGDPATRIAEDYLRVLRFFRFHARFGRGAPDPAALAAIEAAAGRLGLLSAERVWSELKRILAAPRPEAAIDLMDRLGVLRAVLPEAAAPLALPAAAPADPLLRLAAILRGDAAALPDRLRLSGEERARLDLLRAGPAPRPEIDDDGLRRILADTPAPEALIGRTWLAGGEGPDWDRLRTRLAATEVPVFPLEGRDALALGMLPGPAVGRLLRDLRAWWMDGGCRADAAACRAELARRIAG